jgi:hypothetical protein
MATEDDGNVALTLNDVSRFPSLTDRVQQGILDFNLLGRLMNASRATRASPAGSTPLTCSTTATARAGSTAGR